jgi:hypothetical protein
LPIIAGEIFPVCKLAASLDIRLKNPVLVLVYNSELLLRSTRSAVSQVDGASVRARDFSVLERANIISVPWVGKEGCVHEVLVAVWEVVLGDGKTVDVEASVAGIAKLAAVVLPRVAVR